MMTKQPVTVGERIRQARLAKNLNQLQLAKKVGCSKGTISFWENNINRPGGQHLLNLARELGISPDQILGGELPDADVLEEIADQERSGALQSASVEDLARQLVESAGKGELLGVALYAMALNSRPDGDQAVREAMQRHEHQRFLALLDEVVKPIAEKVR